MRKGLVVFALMFLAFWGCSKFKVANFVAPVWDTQFSMPIFDRTYTLGEILYKDSTLVLNGDTTYLQTYPNSNMYFLERSQEIKGIQIGTYLSMSAVPDVNVSGVLNSFTIDSPDSVHYSVPYPNGITQGQTLPVPAIPATHVENGPDNDQGFANYDSATISKGELSIKIHNGYPATVYFQGSEINLLDAHGGPLPIPLDSIQANDTYETTLSLEGRVLTNKPVISFTYSSDGVSGNQTYQSTSLLSFAMGFSELEVSHAHAIVPPQTPIEVDTSLVLSEGDMVTSAVISSGVLTVSMTNRFNMAVSPVTLVINSLLDPQGNPLTRQFHLSAAGTSGDMHDETIDLAGFTLNMADPFGNPSDSLRYTVTIGIPGSQGQFIDIDQSNSIETTFGMPNGLTFRSFTGQIHPKDAFPFASDTQRVDMGDFRSKFRGGITFLGDSTHFRFTIRKYGFPYFIHISLVPINTSSGASSTIPIAADTVIYPQDLLPAGQENTLKLGRIFADALNEFARTYGKIPDAFVIEGYARVNPTAADVAPYFLYTPPTGVRTIHDTDKINITNTITLPLQVGIADTNGAPASFIDTSTVDSGLSAKLTKIDTASISFDVNNGLPLNVTILAELLDTNNVVTPLDSIVIPAAEVASDGSVVSSTFHHSPVVLTADQAREFGNSRIIYTYHFLTALGLQPVPFLKTNTISLKVYGTFKFRVDKNTLK
jgi:hypothetical protein